MASQEDRKLYKGTFIKRDLPNSSVPRVVFVANSITDQAQKVTVFDASTAPEALLDANAYEALRKRQDEVTSTKTQ